MTIEAKIPPRRLYADRAVGGDRNYRRARSLAAAGDSRRPANRPASAHLQEQPAAVRHRHACVCRPRPERPALHRRSDFRRDGCMDTWGWVADLVNSGAAQPDEMLCPSNPLKGPEKLNDLLGQDTTDAKDGADLSRLVTASAAKTILAASRRRRCDVRRDGRKHRPARGRGRPCLYRKRLQHELFRRLALRPLGSEVSPRHHDHAAELVGILTSTSQGMKGLSTTDGPLGLVRAENSKVRTSQIPLLGDAAPGDMDEATLNRTVPPPRTGRRSVCERKDRDQGLPLKQQPC